MAQMRTAASLRNADGTLKTSAATRCRSSTANSSQVMCGSRKTPNWSRSPRSSCASTTSRVARLDKAHPDWSGDQLYQAARAVTTAEYQNIVYSEFLPSLLGPGAGAGVRWRQPSLLGAGGEESPTLAFRVWATGQIRGQPAGHRQQWQRGVPGNCWPRPLATPRCRTRRTASTR